jgi:hypothetical protein
MKDINHFRAQEPVKDVAPISVGGNQASFPQNHQVLGNAGLPHTQNCFQMANTGFLLADGQQDLYSGRLANKRKQP